MSLPSIEFLQEQARRLVAYMGDKHRFRLKPASSLEAVAAEYGFHDWNTLRAMAAREEAASHPALPPQMPQHTFPLTWTRNGMADFSVSSNDWFRHTLAIGGTKTDRQAWLQQHWVAQVERKGAGVFINTFGGDIPPDVCDLLNDEGLLVMLAPAADEQMFRTRQAATGRTYQFCGQPGKGALASALHLNLMADMAPDEIASMLVEILFRTEEHAGADYYRQTSHYLLSIVVQAMHAAATPVTLNGLLDVFDGGGPAGLLRLMHSLDPESPAGKQLSLFLAHFLSKGEVFREKDWALNVGVPLHGLRRLSDSGWAHTLFSDRPDARGLFTLLQQGKCLVIEGPDGSDGRPEKSVLYALRSAIARRLMLPREDKAQGWVFALSELDKYWVPALATMVEQSRSSRTALLMTTRDTGAFKGHPIGQRLLDNVWNQLHLSGCPRERLLELVEQLAHRPVLAQPGRITATLGI
ncbi:glyoxalase superfamily protein [Burkholderia ubonensis]|uniref:glyoxalase superfamily protein n=1 Tax=Burkholderia ubonensis TaxID=101571 RepID=UPI0012FA9942|nr:glyoxalase superfamily protein [Burkholderia ubonensis]